MSSDEKSTRINFQERCKCLYQSFQSLETSWKKLCFKGLRVSSKDLNKYFTNETAIPEGIWRKLESLEEIGSYALNDILLIQLYATSLIRIVHQIEEKGYVPVPHLKTVERTFHLAAYRNFCEGTDHWPTDVPSLLQRASQPLEQWVGNLSWDHDSQYLGASLMKEGWITSECRSLASTKPNPEQEYEENKGYKLLMKISGEHPQGSEFYRVFRRMLIENPVIAPSRLRKLVASSPLFAAFLKQGQSLNYFYKEIHESFIQDGKLPVCSISGILLKTSHIRGESARYETRCRIPEAIQRAHAGQCSFLDFEPNSMRLRDSFEKWWCLPGLMELVLEKKILDLGYNSVELWPERDMVDLVIRAPHLNLPLAIDMKDYENAAQLARDFQDFKGFERSHDCYLVVSDYLFERNPKYQQDFERERKRFGKPIVKLRSVSKFLKEVL